MMEPHRVSAAGAAGRVWVYAAASVAALGVALAADWPAGSSYSTNAVIALLSTAPWRMALACNAAIATLATMHAGLINSIFDPRLRAAEISAAGTKGAEIMLAKFVFLGAILEEPDLAEIAAWGAWFSVTGYIRILQTLVKERLGYLASITSVPVHARERLVGLLSGILATVLIGVATLFRSFYKLGLSISTLLLLALDPSTIVVDNCRMLLRYGVGNVAEEDRKSDLLFVIDVACDLGIYLLLLAHQLHVWIIHGVSLTIIDGILLIQTKSVLLSMIQRIKQYKRYREALNLVDRTYPTADQAELATADPCAICMSELNETTKKLPCGHLFHLACLRAALEVQTTCPMCRSPVFRHQNHPSLNSSPSTSGSVGPSGGGGVPPGATSVGEPRETLVAH